MLIKKKKVQKSLMQIENVVLSLPTTVYFILSFLACPILLGIPYLGQWFSPFSMHQTTWRACCQTEHNVSPKEFLIQEAWGGGSWICILNKFPGEAGTAVPGPHFEDHWSRDCALSSSYVIRLLICSFIHSFI